MESRLEPLLAGVDIFAMLLSLAPLETNVDYHHVQGERQ